MKFIIPVTPVAKGRPRQGKYGFYTPKKTKDAESVIRRYVWSSMSPYERKSCPLSVPLRVDIKFFIPTPKSLSKRKTEALLGTPHTKKPDLDNLVKMIDSLNGVLFSDDSIIHTIHASKQWSDKGQIILEVSSD